MMYNNQPYYGYQPAYYGVNGPVPDNLAQLRMNQGQVQTPVITQPVAQQTQTQTNSGLLWVQGEAGAKSYLVAPGHTVMLMDSEGERFYIKSADASGMPMPLRTFEYKERTEPSPHAVQSPMTQQPANTDDFITREEFERRIASISAECKCKEVAKKVKESAKQDEPSV